MTITVTVTPPSVVPAVTSGAQVQVVAGAQSGPLLAAAWRVSVANIDDPSAELAALGDATWLAGTTVIATQDVAGANSYRIYVLDLVSSTAASTPNRINRTAGGQWILVAGKGVAGGFSVETTLAVGGAATVGGTLGVTGAATLASATVTGAATVGTTLGVTGAATLSSTLGVAGVATFSNTTDSSSSSTGAVVIGSGGHGGLGVAGAVNAGGAIASSSTLTGTQLVSTVATGTAPFSVSSTTVVPNLNVSQLLGATWASPAAIGTGTPAAGTFASLVSNSDVAASGKFLPNNSVNAFLNGSQGAVYGSTTGGAGFPFAQAGNLVLEARGGANARAVVLASAGGTYTAYLDAVGTFNVPSTTASSSRSTGAVVIGSVGTGGGLGVAGNVNCSGIAFNDTGSTLSVYQEGTWTPTLIGGTTAGTQTYVTNGQVGRYTRVGNKVFCEFQVEISAKDGAMAGALKIGGLPFTIKNVAGYQPAMGAGIYQGITFTSASYTQLVGYGDKGSTTIGLYCAGSGVSVSGLTASSIAASTAVIGSIMYEI